MEASEAYRTKVDEAFDSLDMDLVKDMARRLLPHIMSLDPEKLTEAIAPVTEGLSPERINFHGIIASFLAARIHAKAANECGSCPQEELNRIGLNTQMSFDEVQSNLLERVRSSHK